ncbi:MAG: phosphatase PAP2 family protein [Clostridia bacterium]|nr:phosphatase PAP2 family protein [Clostridia bacterium]
MNRDQYIRMTSRVRRATQKLPGGTSILRLPTLICAAAYIAALLTLAVGRDMRLIRALIVPACCFGIVTVLRPLIGRQRPYDRFDTEPVGRYRRGKGKSMPSRHTASAAAIACAVIYVFPSWPIAVAMLLLCALIAALRVLSGQHYTSDVLAALALSFILSLIGYTL